MTDWTAVVLTAASERQADAFREQIERRVANGHLPSGRQYHIVPDPDSSRLGSGGATLHALARIESGLHTSAADWWARSRVLMIHSGGDSRRLPQYSASGKLFGALPIRTPWGAPSTVFDELMAMSVAWPESMPPGLLVAAGDVLLRFCQPALDWTGGAVHGIAIRQPVAAASQHGVYALDDEGRVYSFLQKPSRAALEAAGALLPGDEVALDTGLLFFDAALAAALTELASSGDVPVLDLYDHFTRGLTGQWTAPAAGFEARLASLLRGAVFACSLTQGEFTHIGSTRHFRAFAAATGGMIDSVVAGHLSRGAGAVLLECNLEGDVRAGSGSVLHGLTGISGPVEVPEDTVVHQLPIVVRGGRNATVIRVYGVEDDPNVLASDGGVTWFGRPVDEVLAELGLDARLVWPNIPTRERSLWNAELFPAASPGEAWDCARWLIGHGADFDVARWRDCDRLSLATSSTLVNQAVLAEARRRRTELAWSQAAVGLAAAGTDIRPILANPPSVAALSVAGHDLVTGTRAMESVAANLAVAAGPLQLTSAASRYINAAILLQQAGESGEAAEAEARAFACVERAVQAGVPEPVAAPSSGWQFESVTVSAPPRVDLGGGWSDTPPFCLDWGGTVLNLAISINGAYPIEVHVRRLRRLVCRSISEETNETAEFGTTEDLAAALRPGSPHAIPAAALRVAGIAVSGRSLYDALSDLGGGIEFRLRVALPLGSGLGTSSILAAAVVRALAEMRGFTLAEQQLSDEVMRLEQTITTGGGWQDQAGGIYPGAKLLSTGPGARQRIRVQPVAWSETRRQEFLDRLVIYNTGIRRIAKNLLRQVVRSYLAREVATVQVLHSIKTLAAEMAYAMGEGEWDYLGELLDRHWELNKVLDPNTTNAPINALLDRVRPWLAGAKLAGAGGGGFLILLASDPGAADALRETLGEGVQRFRIAEQGLRVTRR